MAIYKREVRQVRWTRI